MINLFWPLVNAFFGVFLTRCTSFAYIGTGGETMCNCTRGVNCTVLAVISAVVVGVVTAFLQVLGIITVAAAFLPVTLGIGLGYLALLVPTAVAVHGVGLQSRCLCRSLGTLLFGVLGTLLVSLVLLAIGIVATSVLSAILVGVLLFFLWLSFAATACFVRCVTHCE